MKTDYDEKHEYKPDDGGLLDRLFNLTGRHLGKGAFASVEEAVDIRTGEKIALKRVQPRTRKTTAMFWNEVTALRAISHPFVVSLKEIYPDHQYASADGDVIMCHVLSLELCHNGDLFRLISETGHLEEAFCRKLAGQLFSGLLAIHRAGMCHRDIKLENLLLDEFFNLKIADFGNAQPFDPKTHKSECYTEAGTAHFLAPEIVFRNRYVPYDGTKADVWNAGVVCFILLLGFAPFDMARPDDWYFDKLRRGRREDFWSAHLHHAAAGQGQGQPAGTSGARGGGGGGGAAPAPAAPAAPPPPAPSGAARRLVDACFAVDPAQRPGAARLLEAEDWLRGEAAAAGGGADGEGRGGASASRRAFQREMAERVRRLSGGQQGPAA